MSGRSLKPRKYTCDWALKEEQATMGEIAAHKVLDEGRMAKEAGTSEVWVPSNEHAIHHS
jgi:hypothetical protein